MDCIFCKIVAGEIPSFKVYEDDHTLAFMDINPLAEGHTLVVPKRHCTNLFDADDETLAVTLATVRKVAVALKDALGIDSLNMLQANGKWAAQSVLHLHFHLVPRRENDKLPLDWQLVPGDMAAIQATSAKVAAKLA